MSDSEQINANGHVVPIWVNGEISRFVDVADRGLAYGDGLFETIRVTDAGPVLLPEHLDRLQLGMQRLGFPSVAISHQLSDYPGIKQPGIVKIIVTRGSGGRGYDPSSVLTTPTLIFMHTPMPNYPASYAQVGVDLYLCNTALSINPALAGIKHLNRLEQVLARREWHFTEYQEGLLLDSQHYVIECCSSNLIICKGNKIETPMLDQCGIKGTMRDWLLQKYQANGVTVMETRLSLDDVLSADEVFICNSVNGVWPVRKLQVSQWQSGPMACLAQQWISENFEIN